MIAAARAFYVCWWADREEELGRGYPGQELTECAPETQRWAFKLARELAIRICLKMHNSIHYNYMLKYTLEAWIEKAEGGDRELTEENIGFYAAMSAMGQGVGLRDLGIKTDVVPYMEGRP